MFSSFLFSREIATKVLGAKMLQGYTLKEKQCDLCGMPLMEKDGHLDCVVCPALAKKAKKKLKEKQRLAEEQARMERQIATAKEERLQQVLQADRERRFEEQREMERQHRRREAEQARVMAVQEEERAHIEMMQAEEQRLVAEAQEEERGRIEYMEWEEQRLLAEARAAKHFKFDQDSRMADETKAEMEQRRREELRLLEETARLERMEIETATDSTKKDWMLAQEQKRMTEMALLESEIKRLEQGRHAEEEEYRNRSEELRAEEEARMIEELEAEADEKARAAEEAIARAKAALSQVSSARKDIIAQTIAMAEAEAIAEAETFIKSHREDYKSPVILLTKSDIKNERWQTLRTEGRSIMTRRVMTGWTLVAEFCHGVECEGSPLIVKGKKKECVVCGGCGDGKDGVYVVSSEDEEYDDDTELASLKPNDINGMIPLAMMPQVIDHTFSPNNNRTVAEIHEDFETKRNMVSKELGKRMVQGWTLLDASCPNCVMPLMMDIHGNGEICVLCGLISKVTGMPEMAGTTVTEAPPVLPPTVTETPPVQEVESPRKTSGASQFDNMSEIATLDPTLQYFNKSQLQPLRISQDASFEAAEAITVQPMSTRNEFEVELPSAPTMEAGVSVTPKAEEHPAQPPLVVTHYEEQLADRIRQHSQRAAPAPSPRGDPPESLKKPTPNRRIGGDPDDMTARSKERKKKTRKPEDAIEANRSEPSVEDDDDTVTISLPRDFDFNDPDAFKRLMAQAKESKSTTKTTPARHDHANFEITENGSVFMDETSSTMSKDEIIKQFFCSHQGLYARELVDIGQTNSVFELAESYVSENFGSYSSDEKRMLAVALLEKVTQASVQTPPPPPPPARKGMSVPEPKAFDFSFQETDASTMTSPTAGATSKASSSRRVPPKPEEMSVTSRGRSPPKPEERSVTSRGRSNSRRASGDSTRSASPIIRNPPQADAVESFRESTSFSQGVDAHQLPPKNSPPKGRRALPPRNSQSQSPRNSNIVVVGGPQDALNDHDDYSLGGASRASTVATQTLDSILGRIEDAKETLMDPRTDAKKQLEAANLIERLAAAACAMKKLESLTL
jgi:uncharacterized Zn finger protein (UPF0148 family)